MIVRRLLLLGFVLVLCQNASATNGVIAALWTLTLSNAFLPISGGFQRVPEQNRSCGIARWDDAHVLIYYLRNDRRVMSRMADESKAGSWSFLVEILNVEDGKLERSAIIPVGSVKSELVVTAGGIVVSDPDHLVFYSRSFEPMRTGFSYVPMHQPIPTLHGPSSDPEHLYVTDDQHTIVLVDADGRRSHVYVFDGIQMNLLSDWLLSDAGQDMSIGDRGMIYRGFDDIKSIYWTSFDGKTVKWDLGILSGLPQPCVIPVYITSSKFLNVCGSPELIDLQSRHQLYQLQKGQRTGLPAAISPAMHSAAIFMETYKGGCVLDSTEHRVGIDLIIVGLDDKHNSDGCRIPIAPLPHTQFAIYYFDDATLITVIDGTAKAYKPACFS